MFTHRRRWLVATFVPISTAIAYADRGNRSIRVWPEYGC